MAKKQEKLNESLLNQVENGYYQGIDDLVKNGADVNYKNEKGHIPILRAHDALMTQKFIENGANLNVRDHNNNGQTPLMRALTYQVRTDETGYPLAAKALIDGGANVNQKDYNGQTALMQSKSSIATGLLIEAKANVNAVDHEDKSVLMHSLNKSTFRSYEADRLLIVEKLVEAGADVNYARPMDLKTPLMLVQDVSDAQFLLAAGADITAKDAEGKVPHEQERFNDYKDVQAYLRNTHLNHLVESVNEVEEEHEYQPSQQRQRI